MRARSKQLTLDADNAAAAALMNTPGNHFAMGTAAEGPSRAGGVVVETAQAEVAAYCTFNGHFSLENAERIQSYP